MTDDERIRKRRYQRRWMREKRQARREAGHCVDCAEPTPVEGAYCATHGRIRSLISARRRAAKLDLPFSLTVDDLTWPDECPVPRCGRKLAWGGDGPEGRSNSPSLDRLVPELGYVAGNVIVVCNNCNRRWGDLTIGAVYELLTWRRAMASLGGVEHHVQVPREYARARLSS